MANEQNLKEQEEWIAKGHAILDEKYWAKWDACVPIRLADLYKGRELGACLDIVKELNEGCTLEHAKDLFEHQNHTGLAYSLVSAMVRSFCDRGEEFQYALETVRPPLSAQIQAAQDKASVQTSVHTPEKQADLAR